MTAPAISLVIPAYNSVGYLAANVARVAAFFEDAGIDGEIVVADDGSTDGTAESVVASERVGDDVLTRAAHADFHFCLYADSGSSWLPRLIRPLWENSERYRIASLYDRGSLERRRAEHEQILAGCVAHDADAAEDALRAHLVTTEELIARHMGSAVPV